MGRIDERVMRGNDVDKGLVGIGVDVAVDDEDDKNGGWCGGDDLTLI